MTDDISLQEKIRDALEAGELPSRLPDRRLGGAPTGGRCAVCGRSTRGGVELELVFAEADGAGPRSYFAHPRCVSMFEREILSTPDEVLATRARRHRPH